ncbi:hypothetical protein [Tardiphaga sp.]|uniref:hypothetical protein n=1 Tax=Tardiphaga sp. TaxID=1926292 RepID=UPI002638D72A|nr:hypothetical protein [Tardiphaga sp.]MDB5616416.1 hypothetical protein [Tardiphaga sp.]
MADADLDVVIRQIAKQQNKTVVAAAKKRRDHYLALAAKAADAGKKARFRQLAKDALEHGTFAARRLLTSADNAADSYARAMRMAVEAPVATPPAPAKKTPAAKKAPARKAAPAKKPAKPKKKKA